MTKKLLLENFRAETDVSKYSCILFTVNKCPQCDKLVHAMNKVSIDFPGIQFFDFNREQKMCELLLEDLGVYPMSLRMVWLKGKSKVGTYQWNSVEPIDYEKKLRELCGELKGSGLILSKSEDTDEVVIFRNKLLKIINFDGLDNKEKANKLEKISDRIIETNSGWGIIPLEKLKTAVEKIEGES